MFCGDMIYWVLCSPAVVGLTKKYVHASNPLYMHNIEPASVENSQKLSEIGIKKSKSTWPLFDILNSNQKKIS